MTGEPAQPGTKKYVLFDVDGTLIDAVDNQCQVWRVGAERYGLDPDEVYQVAPRTRPMEIFAQVIPDRDPRECLAALHDLEDEDVRSGVYTAFDGASELLNALPTGSCALVTSNYGHRGRGRFARTGLPVPDLIVDAASVEQSGLRAGMTVWGGQRSRCRRRRAPSLREPALSGPQHPRLRVRNPPSPARAQHR